MSRTKSAHCDFLGEEQELSQRIQIQIKHEMLRVRDFNTCLEEILLGGFTPNQ